MGTVPWGAVSVAHEDLSVCLHVSMGPMSNGALCVRVWGAVPSVFLSRGGGL